MLKCFIPFHLSWLILHFLVTLHLILLYFMCSVSNKSCYISEFICTYSLSTLMLLHINLNVYQEYSICIQKYIVILSMCSCHCIFFILNANTFYSVTLIYSTHQTFLYKKTTTNDSVSTNFVYNFTTAADLSLACFLKEANL